MKTVRVLAYSDSAIYSGAEAVFAAACLGLVAAGLDLRCAVPSENTELRAALRDAGVAADAFVDVRPQPLRLAGAWLWSPPSLARARRVLRRERPEVLLVNLPSFEYGGTPLLCMGRCRRPPAVGLVHIHHLPRAVGMRGGRLRGICAGAVPRRLDRLLAVSPAAPGEIARGWGVDAERVGLLALPRARPPAWTRSDARRRLGFADDARVIALLGRISRRQKGQDVFVDAAAIVLCSHPGTVFALAGSGPDEEAVAAAIAARGIGGSVRMLGHVDGGMVLAATDLVAFPSRFEGLPLAALEAAAAGRPGIASDVDGLRALWPRCWRVAPGDSAALAAALTTLLEAPQQALADGVAELRAAAARLTTDDCSVPVLTAIEAVGPR